MIACLDEFTRINGEHEKLLTFSSKVFAASSAFSIIFGVLGLCLNLPVSAGFVTLLRKRRIPWKRYLLIANVAVTDCITSVVMIGAGCVQIYLDKEYEKEVANNEDAAAENTNEVMEDALYLVELLVFLIPVVNYTFSLAFQFMAVRMPLLYQVRVTKGRTFEHHRHLCLFFYFSKVFLPRPKV